MIWRQLFGRLHRMAPATQANRSAKGSRKRRRMQVERMERRVLLANDLAAISGVTFDDLNANGTQDVGEPVIPNATVSLYRETNVNGQFDDDTQPPANRDRLAGTIVSDANGFFRFPNLDGPDNDNPGDAILTKNPDGVGTYWLVQDQAGSRRTPEPIQVDITDDSGVPVAQIDDYSATAQSVTDDSTPGSTTESVAATEAIGGARDVAVTNNAGGGQLTVLIDTSGGGTLAIGSLGGANGTALIQYDGNDGSVTLDPTGLESGGTGVSLGGGLPGEAVDPQAGFEVLTNAQDPGDMLTITVYSNGNSTSATVAISDAPGITETFVPFSSFAPLAGIDFNDVGAIEASVGLSANNDVEVSIVETRRSNEEVVDIPNVTPVALGGQIFIDNSAGGQNNGVRDGGEPTVNGVTVELYQLASAGDVVDLESDVAVSSQSTAGTGNFNFTDLDPGHYAVVIPANQFSAAGPLFGFGDSFGIDPANDPDDNVDNDDNGTELVSANPAINGAIFSGTITLESNSEPIDDDDVDPNTNTTLDFGVLPEIDLEIVKTLDPSSDVNPSGNALFEIEVTNNGPLDATNVVVTDTFPAGLTPTGFGLNPDGHAIVINGNTVTVTIGDLDASPGSNTTTFQLTASIGPSQPIDLVNTASVTGTEFDVDTSNNSDDADLDFPQADLSIVKTDTEDPVNAGEQITYQITVTNNGPDDAEGVVVTDQLPANVTFNTGDVDGNTAAVVQDPGGDIIATIGDLADQGVATITIVVDVDEDAPTPIQLTNNASVASNPNTDPNLGNNTTDEPTNIEREVDVAVDKSVTGSPVAGQDITYTIEVTNNGPSQATDVEITDTLDADLTFVVGSFDPGTSGVTVATNGQDLTFDVGTLDVDQTLTFSFDVTIASSATGTISNQATATATEPDSVPANDTDSVDIAVVQQIDLILTKTVDDATAVPGQDQLVYTITVEHDTDSPSDATNVVVSDTLPAGLTNVVIDAPTADDTDFTGGVITVDFNSLPAGESRTFTITADVADDATGTITNPASVTASENEPDTSNNSDSAATDLTPIFDVVVDKTVDDATPDPGQTITYTVQLDNEGPSAALGVVLSDAVPAGLTFVSGSLGANTGTLNNGTVTFPAIDIAANDSATATLTFTVDTDAVGTITNTASVPDLSAAGEDDTTNNADSVDITLPERVDLEIEKTVSAANAPAGGALTYTVTVTNNGPSDAIGVQVVDTLPAGVTFVSGTGPNSEALAVNNGVVTVNGGDLANGNDFSFTINVTIDNNTVDDLINTVTVSSTTTETNQGNNTATAVTDVDPVTSSIAGSVYIDADNDGVRDPGEIGIAGVPIALTGTDVLGNTINQNVTTDADGNYLFGGLAAGTYAVEQTQQPAGFIDGIDTVGTNAAATAADDVFTQLGLGEDIQAAQFNFGELETPPDTTFSKRRFLASS